MEILAMNIKRTSRLANSSDYIALLNRRKGWILCSFFVFAGFAFLLSKIVPNVFTSQSLLLYQPREVSSDLVKEISNGANDSRLMAIQETLLSRSNLLKIVNGFQDVASPYHGLSDEKKVERMRAHLKIELVMDKTKTPGMQPVTNVRISYREQDSQLSQKIASRIASLFIEKENKEREVQVYGTANFLKTELNHVLDQINLSSERLKILKERYSQALPAQLDENLRTLDRLRQERNLNIEEVDRQTTLKLNLEQQLATTTSSLRGALEPAARERDPMLTAYLMKEQEYKNLVAKATQRHPDVVRLKAELEEMRKELPSEDLESGSGKGSQVGMIKSVPNPLYQSLSAQLNQANTELDIRRRQRKTLDDQIAQISREIQNTPQVEQVVSPAERSHAELLKQADALREKLDQARLSENIEKKQKGAQFIIIDEANMPSEPDSPNRTAVFLYGALMSLALALVVGMAADISSRKVYTGSEVERLLDAPILVEIPRIASASEQRRMRRLKLRYAALFLLGAGAYIGCLYLLFLNQSHLVELLEPIIEKFQG
jgi:polysaccharide biosynthesis transport protein